MTLLNVAVDCLRIIYTYFHPCDVVALSRTSKKAKELVYSSVYSNIRTYFQCPLLLDSSLISCSNTHKAIVTNSNLNVVKVCYTLREFSLFISMNAPIQSLNLTRIKKFGNCLYVHTKFGTTFSFTLDSFQNSDHDKYISFQNCGSVIYKNTIKYERVRVPKSISSHLLAQQQDSSCRQWQEIFLNCQGEIQVGSQKLASGVKDFCVQKKFLELYKNDYENIMILKKNQLYYLYEDHCHEYFNFNRNLYGDIVRISCNNTNVYALNSNGFLFGFGANSYGQCPGEDFGECKLIQGNVKKVLACMLCVVILTKNGELHIKGFYKNESRVDRCISKHVLDFSCNFNRIFVLNKHFEIRKIVYI